MNAKWKLAILVFLIPMSASRVLAAPPLKEDLADRVRLAIKHGIEFLKDAEKGRGRWELDLESTARPGGWSALAMLALLNAGVRPDDPIIKRGLDYLRGIPPTQTYVVGLQTMVFAKAGYPV
ncbi:MAG: DUF4159 domain-containing protein, partial [Candidatus Acidiferrum sp.]